MHCTAGGGLSILWWASTAVRTSDVLLFLPLAVLAAAWLRHRGWFFRTDGGGSGVVRGQLPPGPPGCPIVGNLLQVILQRRHFVFVLRDLRARYGPVFMLRLGRRTVVVVTSAELAYEALVKRGALFASRPLDGAVRRLFSSDNCSVNSAPYGPLWRALRRNFAAEVASAPRVGQCSWARDWSVDGHLERLRGEFRSAGAVRVLDSCRLTLTGLLLCVCFGAKVPDQQVREIADTLKEVLMMSTPKLPDFFPLLAPLFKWQLAAAREVRRRQLDRFVPLVAARREFVERGMSSPEMEMVTPAGGAYVDSLFRLELPEREGRRLTDEEIVTLLCEVINGGTDTSTATLEWTMMRLMLDPAVQERVYNEVVEAAGRDGRITEAHVEAMPYLQAVVKETLRRHPPTHLLLSHAATEDAELGGYRIPADATVEFYTLWVSRDPKTWPDPGAWQPERFLDGGEGAGTDISGARGVRMLPFGAGRRICPGAALGILHVQLMVAAMVREFRWVPVPGDGPPDPGAEAFAFSVVMENPLRAAIVERGANA